MRKTNKKKRSKKQLLWYAVLSDRLKQRFTEIINDALENTPFNLYDDPAIDYNLLGAYSKNSLMRGMVYKKVRRLCAARIGL